MRRSALLPGPKLLPKHPLSLLRGTLLSLAAASSTAAALPPSGREMSSRAASNDMLCRGLDEGTAMRLASSPATPAASSCAPLASPVPMVSGMGPLELPKQAKLHATLSQSLVLMRPVSKERTFSIVQHCP